jgi:gamma-glutamylcyclotransferase (GGCT)/AIG2-like uncharacterized protein YtfP
MAKRKLSKGRNFILGSLRYVIKNAHKYNASELHIVLAAIDRLAFIDDLYTVELVAPANPRIHSPVNPATEQELKENVDELLKSMKAEFLGGKNANAECSDKTNG